MPSFNSASTAEQVAAIHGQHAKDKTFLITGCNVGLGYETARVLAKHGGIVVITCRSQELCDATVAKLKKDLPEANISGMPVDLGSLKSVVAFTDAYKASGRPIHCLILNAGIMAPGARTLTHDGLETQFGVNHIGHFLLTSRLLPILKSTGSTSATPARVISLSSIGQWLFAPSPEGIPLNDVNQEQGYEPWKSYGISKLANVLLSVEINKRMKEEGANVVACALHPGAIMGTNLSRHMSLSVIWNMMKKLWWRPGAFGRVFRERNKSIPEGAATTIFCALSPDMVPNSFYNNCAIDQGMVHESVSENPQLSSDLWTLSEKIVAEKLAQ